MTPTRRPPLKVRLLSSLALTVAAAALAGGSARAQAAAWTATFTDPAGDVTAGAPDVTKVTITGDAATGSLMFTVTAENFVPATPDGLERRVYLWLNTDKDDETGSPNGNEYGLVFLDDPTGPRRGWAIVRWDGSVWVNAPQGSAQFTRGSELMWTLNAADLGGATGLALYNTTTMTDAAGEAALQDVAPEDGRWVFDLDGPAFTTTHFVTPALAKPVAVPRNAVAGKRFTVSIPVTFDGLQGATPPSDGTIVSRVTIGGKAIPHTRSLTNGLARVSLVVPKTAKGQRIKLQVTITAPSFRGADGYSFGLGTGYIGIVATYYTGKSKNTSATFPVR